MRNTDDRGAPGRTRFTLFFAVILMITQNLTVSAADPERLYRSLPKITLELSGLDETGDLIYIGVDLAVFEEGKVSLGDAGDENSDGRVFRAKEGKVRRFLTNHTKITLDLGRVSDYQKGIGHRIAMRTLYAPAGTGTGEIIIADQNNGKDGWIILQDSAFMLSWFADDGGQMVKHTDQWEENRQRYNRVRTQAGGTGEERPYHTFWSGEMLMLSIETKERVCDEGLFACEDRCGIEVTLYEENDGTWMSFYPSAWLEADREEENNRHGEENTLSYTYQGYLWHEDMIHKWGNDKPKQLRVRVTPVMGGRVVEEDAREETIIMDNRDLFFRIHQKPAQ